MDCAYRAYGLCLFFKATVKERACSSCAHFVNATDSEAISSEIEHRRNDDASNLRIEDELAIEHLLWLRDSNRAFRYPTSIEICRIPGDPPQMWIKRPTEKWQQFAKKEIVRLKEERINKQVKQEYVLQFVDKQSNTSATPTQEPSYKPRRSLENRQRKKNFVYAMSLGDESFLNLHLRIDEERKLLQKKIELLEKRLHATIRLTKIRLPEKMNSRRMILDRLNELLEIIQKKDE